MARTKLLAVSLDSSFWTHRFSSWPCRVSHPLLKDRRSLYGIQVGAKLHDVASRTMLSNVLADIAFPTWGARSTVASAVKGGGAC